MLSDEDIFQRYLAKQREFNKQAQVSLIGHSLFDMWLEQPNYASELAGKSIANLGLSGTSTRQYLDVIIKPKRINYVGDNVFLFLGVNDIVKEPEYSPEQLLTWLQEIVAGLTIVNPKARFFLLEATPVNNITTVTNAEIEVMNTYLRTHCPKDWCFVETQDLFKDSKGNLDLTYCTDGLHFNAKGYELLASVLTKYLA